MNFVPAPRGSVADHVFGQLRDAILRGHYRPGDPLPSERELAVLFGVNRHAVREALRRLQQLGLVRVSQGGATRALDWRIHAGLDLAMSLPRPHEEVLPLDNLVRDVLEMRACIGTDAARHCATRATPTTTTLVEQALDAYIAQSPDLEAMGEANITLWRHIVHGSGNTAYLLAFNSLVGGALAVGHVPPRRRTAELLDIAGHRALVAHIRSGAADAAADQAHALLTAALHTPHPEGDRA